MAWKVLFFQTARGDYPVKEFIEEQNKTIYAKILHSIELLENHGSSLRPPYSKKIMDEYTSFELLGRLQ